jgi:hypothetical protein
MPIVVSDRADATATSFAVEEIEEEQLDCYWRLCTDETEDDRLADVGLEPRGGVSGRRDKVGNAGGDSRLYADETEGHRLAGVGLEPRGGVLGRDKVCKAGGSLFVVLSRRGGVPARGVSDGDGALPWT